MGLGFGFGQGFRSWRQRLGCLERKQWFWVWIWFEEGSARGISFGFGSKVLKKGEKVRRGEERFDLEEVEFDLKDKLWKEG